MNHFWKIYDLTRTISDGMVSDATYACESDYSGSSTRQIGDITLTTGSASDSDFIAYADLTEATVLGWITGSIDTSAIETANSASIAASITAAATQTKSEGTPW